MDKPTIEPMTELEFLELIASRLKAFQDWHDDQPATGAESVSQARKLFSTRNALRIRMEHLIQ